MAVGPGRHDDICQSILDREPRTDLVLVIAAGHKDGQAMVSIQERCKDCMARLPTFLRKLADAIDEATFMGTDVEDVFMGESPSDP